MNEIDKELGKRLLYFDGGMGTLLQGGSRIRITW